MSFKITNTCDCLKETITYIHLEKFLNIYIASLDDEIERLMHTCCNCQSFLWFKIKNSCSKDYVKAYFERNSKSLILKESKV